MKDPLGTNFHLEKWYLDFTGDKGEAMIFYAAMLTWHHWRVPYASWLRYDPGSGIKRRSGFRNVEIPKFDEGSITWKDPGFRISGRWRPKAEMIRARILESDEGYVEWNCYQPVSEVGLKINDEILTGNGYAEQLILTVPPWKIPMDELRWGHSGQNGNNVVWIELREKEMRQWLWLNGERMQPCIIEDDRVAIPQKEIILELDCSVLLEEEKKIRSVTEKLVRCIPGIKKSVPLKFLMADEIKWLSRCRLHAPEMPVSDSMAIHERVIFRSE